MNGTFMFDEDRFGNEEDFSIYYRSIGGLLNSDKINRLIRNVYGYLDERYPAEEFRHDFPSLKSAIDDVSSNELPASDTNKIIATFAFHERGKIPVEYISALHSLAKRFTLAVVIDIWSPKDTWLEEFEKAGISELFSAMSFSSDLGMVKPSPRPFELVLNTLGLGCSDAVVIGDSIRRDLGGAMAAGIDCILVGGATHNQALASYRDLLEFAQQFEHIS